MSHPSSSHPVGLRLWLCYCATTTAGGWLLSAVRSLTPLTMGLLVLVSTGLWMWVVRHDRQSSWGEVRRTVRRWCRFRGRHALPALYMAIAVVSLGGAMLNEPYNYDSFWYRIPRMHHWLAERQWHWVHTHEFRINASATFSEWINLPILALVPGVRAMFLSNLVTYLLLPGPLFVFLEALGVKRRVAWHWMWILPCGWVYAFQAGSLANDILSTPLLLGAILYACQAARRVPHALAWSLLARADNAYQWRHESLTRYRTVLARIPGERTIGCLLNGPGEHLFWDVGLRVHDVKPVDDPTQWRNLGLHYLVVDSSLLGSTPVTAWATSHHLRIIEHLGDMGNLQGILTPVYLMELLPTPPAG